MISRRKSKLKWPALRDLSLGLRLTALFLAVALLVWLAAGAMTWRESREQLDEFFDSYQLLLAHQLAAANWITFKSKDEFKVRSPLDRLEYESEAAGWDEDDIIGEADDDALGFAVFNRDGDLIFSDGDKGRDFPFEWDMVGFVDSELRRGRNWRLVRIKSLDGRFVVAVGQRLDYRLEASLKLAVQLLLPWLAGLIFLTGATIWMVGRELKPLKNITRNLSGRAPDDLSPLDIHDLPPEVTPLGLALNNVFDRLGILLLRERSFVSDAAHELRTPLTALKVQAEVAQLAHDDPTVLAEALANLTAGIDRTARLVEQLLALSRLDGGVIGSDLAGLAWNKLIEEAIIETETSKQVTINYHRLADADLAVGRPLLIGLMLRNLLDNARRYSPEGAVIDIVLDGPTLSVTNSGAKVDENHMARLGERFFRPPGQAASGSGLGLSIVGRVAEMHGLEVSFKNVPPDGFAVILHKTTA